MRNYFREIGVGFEKGGPWGQIWSIKFGCRPNVLPVVAEPNANGGVTVRLTNEECTPTGGAGQIGRATEVMVSNRSDFNGATWEPFVTTKVVQDNGNVFVRCIAIAPDARRRRRRAAGPARLPCRRSPPSQTMTVSVPGFTAGANRVGHHDPGRGAEWSGRPAGGHQPRLGLQLRGGDAAPLDRPAIPRPRARTQDWDGRQAGQARCRCVEFA
jgi:hypothetical protein